MLGRAGADSRVVRAHVVLGVKRPREDELFSDLVRCRAEYRCEFCGKYVAEPDRQRLHCSHILSRSRRATRWHPLNAMSACASCHAVFGQNPLAHADAIREIRGHREYEVLKTLGMKTIRLKKHHIKEIRSNLKASWQDMQARRRAGETGRIEFEDPMPDSVWATTSTRAA